MANSINAEMWSDEYKDAKCSICAKKKKDQTADYYCYDCSKHLCTSCLGFHNDFLENHNVVQRQGDNKDVITEKCGKHADELITLNCRQHDELLCKKFRLLDHSSKGAVGGDVDKPVDIPAQAVVRSPGDHQVGRPVEEQGDVIGKPEIEQITIKIPGDKDTCNLVSCCHLPDGSLVVADHNNSRLKLVDPSSSKITKYCDINGRPVDVCCVGPQEVAVSFFLSPQIYVYNTVSLTRTRTVKFKHNATWISCHGGLLYCATWPGSNIVYVHDLSSGRTVRKISVCADDGELLSFITHIAVNSSGDRVYVVDRWKGLVCVGVYGMPMFHLSADDLGLSQAYSVTFDHRGHVYVRAADSYTVAKVTEDGHVVGQILSKEDKIKWSPTCLTYDVIKGKLIVGCEDSDHLLMLEL